MKCQRNMCPNAVTCKALINGFCKVGKLEEAMKLFYERPNRNTSPNVVTYNALIDGFYKGGKLEEARKYF